MATVANDSGHLVTFLALPERQWLYVNERAHECGVNADGYVSLALRYFDSLPDSLRYNYVMINYPTPVPDETDGDGRPDADTDQ